MSDIRFIIIGIILIFSSIMLLEIFGYDYQTANIENREFSDCHRYSNSKETVLVSCDNMSFEIILFFTIVLTLIFLRIASLIKGIKGNRDSKVNPEETWYVLAIIKFK